MSWYRVVLRVRMYSSDLVTFVSYQDYADSSDDALAHTIDYSIQTLLYDVLDVVSVTALPG